jgi:hypothetical protein
MLRKTAHAQASTELLGFEGNAAAAYFHALPCLVGEAVEPELRPIGRSRLPPKDAFNALLSYGYGMRGFRPARCGSDRAKVVVIVGAPLTCRSTETCSAAGATRQLGALR